ncbi:MAG: hypothetical protein WAL98_17915 [Desulfatiglandaceae bacterium]
MTIPIARTPQTASPGVLDGDGILISALRVGTDSLPYQDDLVCFSNNSDNIDVAAPGSVIWSAMPDPDKDKDGDVDGVDLAALINDYLPEATEDFAEQFGRCFYPEP